jgi:hypothetical protein
MLIVLARRRDLAEETICLIVDPGGEEEFLLIQIPLMHCRNVFSAWDSRNHPTVCKNRAIPTYPLEDTQAGYT